MNMKQHTTNYKNTFIEVTEDSLISEAKIPPQKREKTIANLQYEIILKNPYKYTSDDIILNAIPLKMTLQSVKNPQKGKTFSPKISLVSDVPR